MFAGSWFYDPSLAKISPRLAYLHTEPCKYGARLFKLGTSQDAIRLALLKSATRRQLYEDGKYTPTQYAILWLRKHMLRWQEKVAREEQAAQI